MHVFFLHFALLCCNYANIPKVGLIKVFYPILFYLETLESEVALERSSSGAESRSACDLHLPTSLKVWDLCVRAAPVWVHGDKRDRRRPGWPFTFRESHPGS